MTTRKCSKRNRSGKPCEAPAGPNGVCAFHANPDRARQLGAIGGRNNRHRTPEVPEVALEPPQDASEVKVALGRVMADVHNGSLDTKRATTVVYAATALLKALETSDLESRIKRLEERAHDAKTQS